MTATSCNDFLTESNPNAVTNGSFWENESDALQGLAAVYGVLQYSHVMGGEQTNTGMVMGDVGRSNPWEATPISLQDFSYNESNMFFSKKWNQLYIGIFRANQVLEFVPNIQMDEKKKESILTEAHFLRGLYYFWLMHTYNEGSIPIHTIVPKELSDYNKPLSPRDEVYSLVVSDLTYAAQSPVLPEKWDDKNIGRVTWGAAQGILGQFYLYEKKYDMAAAQFKKIIDRKDLYSLVEEIGWNFDIEHEWNKESIFEVNFSDAVKPGTSGYDIDSPTGSEATTRPRISAPQEAGGWSVILPSAWMREMYMNDPVDKSRPENTNRTYSKRCEASIYFHTADYPFYTLPEGIKEFAFSSVPVAAYIKKFQNWNGRQKEDLVTTRSGINERILRLADVYLMYSEALIQENGDAQAGTAIEFINEVRSRSGVVLLKKEEYTTKESVMNHLMYIERPLELAFEGHNIRWYDLRRWGIVKEWYAKLADKEWRFPEMKAETPSIKQFGNSAKNFTDKNYTFPIPNEETNRNPFIK